MSKPAAGKVYRPYVDALFEVAGSPSAVEGRLAALDAFAAGLDASEELRSALRSPSMARDAKRAVVRAVAEKVGCDELSCLFLTTLLSHGHLSSLPAILAAVRRRLDAEHHVVEAVLRSPAPLSPEAAQAVKTALEAKTGAAVRLVTETDPGLLAGFVVKVGSEVYDASLSRRLEKVKRALEEASPVG